MTQREPKIDRQQVHRAAVALLKHIAAQQARKSDLFDEDEIIYLVIALSRQPQGPRKDKPIKLPLQHPLHNFDEAEVCLFVKDHKGEGHRAAKEQLALQQVSGVAKIVGLSKLRSKYEAHEAKRKLCSTFDLFLADDRILPSLPKLIGKQFFRKKKQPIPVSLSSKDWSSQVRQAIEATYMLLPRGTCINIKVAKSSFTAEECVENIMTVLAAATHHIAKGWQGVRAVHLKTTDSVALPMYQQLPQTPLAIPAVPAAAVVTT